MKHAVLVSLCRTLDLCDFSSALSIAENYMKKSVMRPVAAIAACALATFPAFTFAHFEKSCRPRWAA
jgi:hypothetical protein